MALPDVFIALGSGVGGSILGYLGLRYSARQSANVGQAQIEVDQRKVDQEAFDRFVQRYEQERLSLVHKLDQTMGWLVTSLKYVKELRKDVIHTRPLTPMPEELRAIPVWLLEDDETEGSR